MIFLALIADAAVAVTLGFLIGRYSMKAKISSIRTELRNIEEAAQRDGALEWSRLSYFVAAIRKHL